MLLSVLVVSKHQFCNTLWLTIFCALVLFDCACDMDHESVINEVLILLVRLEPKNRNLVLFRSALLQNFCLAIWLLPAHGHLFHSTIFAWRRGVNGACNWSVRPKIGRGLPHNHVMRTQVDPRSDRLEKWCE